MASEKRISSVAHSTAHHAVSGLCCVIPHLGRACAAANKSYCNIDLLATDPCPGAFRAIEPLKLALASLKQRFLEILATEGFQVDNLQRAVLRYEFYPCGDDYTANCAVTISTTSGKRFKRAVDYLGRSAKVQDIGPNPALE